MLKQNLSKALMTTLILFLSACTNPEYSGNSYTKSTTNNSKDVDNSSTDRVPIENEDSSDQTPEPLSDTDNYCGGFSVVGGTPATMGDMVTKSTALLVIGQGTCTGTFIGPNQISTAAHCVESNPAANTIQIAVGLKPTAPSNLKVTGYAIHPGYKGLNISSTGYPAVRLYDVAVIAFEGTIPAGYGIAPVGSTASLQTGTEVTVAGYGAYSENDQQARPLTWVKKKVALFDRNYKEIQLEVGGGTGACYGDSGGPSYIMSEDGMCLYTLSTTTGPGRTSNGNCDQGHGTLMDITAHQGWMKCAYEKLGKPLPYLLADESKSACNGTTTK